MEQKYSLPAATRSVTLALTLLFALLTFIASAQAQTPTPTTPRDALTQAIQERAQRDAELGKAQQSIVELNLLFGEEAKVVGLPMPEALLIYEDAYAAALPVEAWWKSLRPGAGWIVAAILFALVVFQNIIKDYNEPQKLDHELRWI